MQLFDTYIDPKAIELVNEVLKSGYINQGKYVDLLEKKLEEEIWLKNVVTINSCSNALYLAVQLSGASPGDEIIISPQTFIAGGLIVLWAGCTPVFADVDINGNLRADDVELKITAKTRAIICTHWSGIPCDMEEFWKLGQKYNIKIIEDAAHALGSTYKTSMIGDCKYSDFCTFSLQAIKLLTSGDGGLLCCRSEVDKERAIKARWFGIDRKNVQRGPTGDRLMNVETLGFKMHMNDIAASLAVGNMENIKERINHSRIIADIYFNRLSDLPLELPWIFLPHLKECNPSYFFFQARTLDNRDILIKRLREHGVPASTVDRRIDNQPIFQPYKRLLIGATLFDEMQFALPTHYRITYDDAIFITDTIKKVINEYKSEIL